MSRTNAVAHDPSAPAEHLPGFGREERGILIGDGRRPRFRMKPSSSLSAQASIFSSASPLK